VEPIWSWKLSAVIVPTVCATLSTNVDPDEATITVLRLEDDEYTEHGRFGAGQQATSHLLPGFAVSVDEVWAAAQ